MLKFLVKDSLVYGLANMLQKLVPFLIIPVITNYLGSEALKIYDVAFVYAYLFSWVIILGQDNAASILYFSNKSDEEKRQVLNHGLIIQLSFLLLTSIFFFPVKNFVSFQLFPSDKAIETYWLKALLIIPGHIVLNYVLNILLWQQKEVGIYF